VGTPLIAIRRQLETAKESFSGKPAHKRVNCGKYQNHAVVLGCLQAEVRKSADQFLSERRKPLPLAVEGKPLKTIDYRRGYCWPGADEIHGIVLGHVG
jgi:hypothetical protein